MTIDPLYERWDDRHQHDDFMNEMVTVQVSRRDLARWRGELEWLAGNPRDRCIATMKTTGKICGNPLARRDDDTDLPLCPHHHSRLDAWAFRHVRGEIGDMRYRIERMTQRLLELRRGIADFDPDTTTAMPLLDSLCPKCTLYVFECFDCAPSRLNVTCGRSRCNQERQLRLRAKAMSKDWDAHDDGHDESHPDPNCARCHDYYHEERVPECAQCLLLEQDGPECPYCREAQMKYDDMTRARETALMEFDMLDQAIVSAVQQAVNTTLTGLGIEPRAHRVGALMMGHGARLAMHAAEENDHLREDAQERQTPRPIIERELQELCNESPRTRSKR